MGTGAHATGMSPRWVTVLLAAAVLLAGCAAPPSADRSPPVQPTSAPPAQASAPPGGAGGTGGTAGTAGTAANVSANATSNSNATSNATTPAEIVTPLAYTGTTGTGACVFAAAAGQCSFATGGSNDLKEVAAPGRLRHLVANVTWTAATPATQQMTVLLAHKSGDGWVWRRGDPVVQGPSPLKADWDLSAVNATVALAVDSGTFEGAGPAGAYVSPGQDFAVQGEVRSVP